MHWELRVDKSVHKFLKHIPRKDARRILTAIELLPMNPYAGDIEKMEGITDVWRRRVGAYRILYEVYTRDKMIHIADIRRRGSHSY